jgi:hypothetical protein
LLGVKNYAFWHFRAFFGGGVGWVLGGLGVSGGVLKFVFVFLKSEKHISFVAICFCLWKHQRAGDCGGAFWGIVVCGKSARHPGENSFFFRKWPRRSGENAIFA